MASRLGLKAFADQMRANAAKWTVGRGEMYDAAREISVELPEMSRAIAAVLHTMEAKMTGEQPVHPAVVGVITAAKRAQLAVAATLDQVGPAFRRMHAVDIARVENPRRNEAAWDTGERR
jgi:hypothetical protein